MKLAPTKFRQIVVSQLSSPTTLPASILRPLTMMMRTLTLLALRPLRNIAMMMVMIMENLAESSSALKRSLPGLPRRLFLLEQTRKVETVLTKETRPRRDLKLAASTLMKQRVSLRNSRVALAMSMKKFARRDTSRFLSLLLAMSTPLQHVSFKLTVTPML